jgi:metal-responsive CopG/Arc/MetJ family transcriptional regulator
MSKAIVAKLDEKTLEELDRLAEGTTRSEVVREAVRQYIYARKIDQRRQEVEAYNRTSKDQEAMRRLAESDMADAAELLEQAEGKQ